MKTQDDFTWENYTQLFYEREMVNVLQKKDGLDLIISDFSLDNGEMVFNNNLHPNWMELYHQVHKLDINSVYECGTGCAHHLINISKIKPHLEINGCDYSQSQIDLGQKYFNLNTYEFSKALKVKSFTLSDTTNDLGTYDFVFTQAVTMHLK